jgi:hypothetical protein
LEHVICKQGLLVDLTKIAVILDLEPPTSVRQLRETLGHTCYYRKFIKGYADHNTNGKVAKERSKVSMERRLLEGFGTP